MSAAEGQSEEKSDFTTAGKRQLCQEEKKILECVFHSNELCCSWCSGKLWAKYSGVHVARVGMWNMCRAESIWSLLHESLSKFSAGSLWSSPAALEQTLGGRRQRHLWDWFMHLHKYCCLLKSETAQGVWQKARKRGAMPLRDQVVRIDPRLSQGSGKNVTDKMLQPYWPH